MTESSFKWAEIRTKNGAMEPMKPDPQPTLRTPCRARVEVLIVCAFVLGLGIGIGIGIGVGMAAAPPADVMCAPLVSNIERNHQ